MQRLSRFLIVVACTALGYVCGQFLVFPVLVRLLPPPHVIGGSGDAFAALFSLGARVGESAGISLTAATIGGLLLGVTLARRIGRPFLPAGTRAA